MDLRTHAPKPGQLEQAKKLAIRGLITYQPFIFSDKLETGVGLEFDEGERVGLVYHPEIDPELVKRSPELRRIILDPARHRPFHESNRRLGALYDFFVKKIADEIGDVRGTRFLDIGCNSGYLPLSFSLLGAKEAAGCDRENNFSEVFDFMNGILGAQSAFLHTHYDSRTHRVENCQPYDVVTSMAVLCHLSDPLEHLACLGSLAKKALFLWTLVNPDPGFTIHFGEPQNHYAEDAFPRCFDNKVCPSMDLIRYSLEKMGFRNIHEITDNGPGTKPFAWQEYPFKGILALR